ncbi:DUF3168 domain-containing protein [Pseudaestuariivita rosea]|uniref:DUF3168 domain-containing protein n=1 Tax=Pseudaestuariivita rosea TaxID=2763263 RepID=UPI001ABA2498|nr:DUF3168 domain-containing protein [Pseudaestuariivita rosea]
MSYAVSAALQAAVYQRLADDAGITAPIYDAVPAGTLPDTYVTLGPEDVRDRSDKTGAGATHIFTVSVITDAAGFQSAKALAGLISDALVDADLTLTRGHLIGLHFEKAAARRVENGQARRIDLKFRAHVEDD